MIEKHKLDKIVKKVKPKARKAEKLYRAFHKKRKLQIPILIQKRNPVRFKCIKRKRR